MKVTVSKPEKSQVTITVEAEESDLEKFFEKAAEELSKQVKIDGFREGKIPKDVLEKHVGKEAIRAHALEIALPNLYADAVMQEKVQVIARPEIKMVSEKPFKFEAVVAILPDVEISGHEKIKIKKEDVTVSDKDAEELIDHFRKQNATFPEAKREAKMGDRAEIDFDGFDPKGDVPLEGTSSKNHPVILGDKMLIPGFEEEIVGMKAGEEKEFELSFPKDYHAEKFKGKKVKFKIKLHKVEEVKMPEVTKEWIKKVTNKEMTPEDFKTEVKDNLKKDREGQVKTKREAEFFEKLLELAKVDIPDALIEEEIDFIMDRTKMDLESKGLNWEQYEKFLESQKRDFRADKKEQAENQVKLRLTLAHLYKVEKIEATPEEVKERLEEQLIQFPKEEQEKIRESYKEGTPGYAQIQNGIMLEKFLEKFLS